MEDGCAAKRIKLDNTDNEVEEALSANEDSEKYGMLCRLNTGNPLSGTIKQRYSDFLVREIDPGGTLVELTDLQVNELIPDNSEVINGQILTCPLSENEQIEVEDYMSASSHKVEDKLILSVDNDKEHRGLVHQYLKQFPKFVTDTVTLDNGDKAISVAIKRANSRTDKRNQNNRDRYPKKEPFCHFVLFKQNKDTMSAINLIAHKTHTKPSQFSYAGTKDKQATTIQRVSAQYITQKSLAGLNKVLRGICLGNFAYSSSPIKLGDLSGNAFSLVIRDLSDTEEVIETGLRSLSENGFINYFGHQRFGTGTYSTHDIGKAMLQCDWQKVASLLLSVSPSDDEDIVKMKQMWSNKELTPEAFSKFQVKNEKLEIRFLKGLVEKPTDVLGALNRLPRNTRLLYMHSYQSYIWNHAVSKRIQSFGTAPIEGDLVPAKDAEGSVHALTKENILSGEYTFEDVMLPLPGYDVQYPKNEIRAFYKDFLKNDGLDIENMRHNIKEFSLSGAYRHIHVKPKNMSWNFEKYDDYTIPLIENDYDRITKEQQVEENASVTSTVPVEGKHLAIKLHFTLPPSSYATSALREVLRHVCRR